MRSRSFGVLRLAQPVKAAAQRFAFLLLAGTAAALLILGKADIALIERFRSEIGDVVAPVLSVLRQPVAAIRDVIGQARELANLRSENVRLREENSRLHEWEEAARRYERDNASLRRLLKVTNGPLSTFVSAHIVGDSGSAFVRTMLLDAGGRDGVEKGQAVVSEAGMVGRVVEVGQRSARVLLLTDLNSRIPVRIDGKQYRGVLSGDNSDQPRVDFLPATAQVQAGDRVITSGDGGLLPSGIEIGIVTSVIDGAVRVQPFADWHDLDAVSVVRFSLSVPADENDGRNNTRYGGRR